MEYTKEQIKAAYALNLCTVSVSQIIDYADINIMEQEYEAILNNLNIEQMPKDEALLNILKQIMDTITFFRIEEGDKKFIEKDYQQKMKNAIWAAVPNIGMIVAGGSPVTMAISLASQVGIGYMNYRRSKAEGFLEYEKQRWQLERSAIEQFNGLRRELFDTAWKLSAEYNFPDQLRLTERQIHQYNDILMDTDLIRKYERLDAVKNDFVAYPPFWYQMGNTANAIARADFKLSNESRRYYRTKALEHFGQYRGSNQQGLLREDPVSSACALEYIDLLDLKRDRGLILELLEEALKFSGRRNDILQLASIAYLKLGENDKAAEIFVQLVNEQYNTSLNAQLLSSIYVSKYLEIQSPDAKVKYEILSQRVGDNYLYPMPEKHRERPNYLEKKFINNQRNVLADKYSLVLVKFFEKYTLKFRKIIPAPNSTKKYAESYYMSTDIASKVRKYDIAKVFDKRQKETDYKYRLEEADIVNQLLDLLNEIFELICRLDVINEEITEKLAQCIENDFSSHRDFLNEIETKIIGKTIGLSDMEQLLNLDIYDFTRSFVQKLKEELIVFINTRKEMQDFALAEQNLVDFCNYAGLPDPAELYGKEGNDRESSEEVSVRRFDRSLLRSDRVFYNDKSSKIPDMIARIRISSEKIIIDKERIEFYTEDDPRIDRYFNKNPKLRKDNQLKAQVLAILDDKSEKRDYDLIFTVYGIIPVKSGIVKNTVAYRDIDWIHGKRDFIAIDGAYSNEALNMQGLRDLIKELSFSAKALPENGASAFRLPEIKLPFGGKN